MLPVRGRGEIGRRRRLKIAFPWSAGSSPAVRTTIRPALALLGIAALAGCKPAPGGTITASVVGGPPRLAPSGRVPADVAQRLMSASLAQGLVRFDAAGQIEPGLAERWNVIDGGRTYIFRLREDATWADGSAVTAPDVVAALRRQLGTAGARHPLAPYLSAIDDVVAMTPEVIEVELARPRPDLLKLFAQPELAIIRVRPSTGSGPFGLASTARSGVVLRLKHAPGDDDPDAPPPPHLQVDVIGERAARALARFAAGRADLVSGGTLADWPLVALADLPRNVVRVDPAAGLTGLAVVRRDGFLGDAANRDALAGAFDRQAIATHFGDGWTPAQQVLPETLDSAASPAFPDWAQLAPEVRRAAAAARVTAWRAAHPEPLVIRLALPDGPGATLLWGELGAALLRIGIVPLRVPLGSTIADLRLVDAVAPYDSARWYLATACQPCGDTAAAAVEAARLAPTLGSRAQAIAAADAAVAADAPFIVLARPLRWSAVAARLDAWTPNARAWHPLNHLRSDTR